MAETKVTTHVPPTAFAYGKNEEATPMTPEPGAVRRMGAYNPALMVVHNTVEKGWAGTAHSHPHDQAAYIATGHVRMVCDGKTVELKGGDSFVVAGGVVHQVTALEETVIVDIFTPCRDEFLD